ncbi:PQQ-binding-like beta-propeller repeat protein [Halosimplex litoreum]|uniref:PQQ-binding-like beta-propeller repeat protein n=1 Tax=Halosimplex litoreum TaxID=1198301 RepID=A0A7T3G0G0_9EURY|nr:PQQ-binding-like beta-propeller repeat protein [Halosimplex litoreum]QPV64053.1 PQQ-binding-like beta-propeller repeat protein [Halosimplex litoreum]
MRRRTILAGLGTAAVGSLAGCSGGCSPTGGDRTASEDDAATGWRQAGGGPRHRGRVDAEERPPADPSATTLGLGPVTDGEDTRHSPATAPVVADGRVFVAKGTGSEWVDDPPGGVYALDPDRDDPVWSVAVPSGVTGPPVAVGDTVVVGARDESLTAYDAETGEQRWRVDLGGVPGTPVVAGDRVYVGTDAGRLAAVHPDRAGRCASRSLVSAAARLTKGGRPIPVAPAVDGETAYLLVDGRAENVYSERTAELVALDLSSGGERWRYTAETADPLAAPTVADGVVYVSLGGAVHAVDASEGTREWRFATGFDRPSRPAVGDGSVYVSAKNVYALDAATGAERWRYVNTYADRGTDRVPRQDASVVAGDRVYVGLGALDAETGERVWGQLGNRADSSYFWGDDREGNAAPAGPAVAGESMVATLRSGRVVWFE